MRTFLTVLLAALAGAAFSHGAAAEELCPLLPAGVDFDAGLLVDFPVWYEESWGNAGRLHVFVPWVTLTEHADAWTGVCVSPPKEGDPGGGGGGGGGGFADEFLARVNGCEYLSPLQQTVPEISIEIQNEFLECVTG